MRHFAASPWQNLIPSVTLISVLTSGSLLALTNIVLTSCIFAGCFLICPWWLCMLKRSSESPQNSASPKPCSQLPFAVPCRDTSESRAQAELCMAEVGQCCRGHRVWCTGISPLRVLVWICAPVALRGECSGCEGLLGQEGNQLKEVAIPAVA